MFKNKMISLITITCMVYILVGCVFIGVGSAGQNVLFSENFSTSLSQWKIAGSPTPRIVNSEGNPAPSFCTMDDLNYGGWAVSKSTFDYSSGLSISVDLKPGNASYPDQRSANFRLFQDNTLYTDGSHLRVSQYLINVTLTADNYGSTAGWGEKTSGPWVSFFIRYIKQNGEEDIEKAEEISINSGSNWHNLKIEINEARKVLFYLDNNLLYTSSNSLPSKYSRNSALGLGYRLCYYDNILVHSSSGYSAEDIDDDGDGYTENQGDCNDSNATIHPGATEICGDGIDQDCNGSDLICNNNPDSYSYYLPAFISKQNSWTGIALSNANNNHEADATVAVYNERGNQVAKVGKNLPASGKTSFLVASGLSTLGWMHVNSSQPLSGLAFFAKPPLMADIPFVSKLEKNLVVPHVAQDVNWDTTIMLCNPKNNTCDINVINVNDNGGMVAQKSISLTANGCGSYSLGNLFTAPLGGKIYLQASSEIAAFALYSDTKSGGSYYAGINAVAENYTIKKVDLDGDGYASDVDCNDNDASIHPGAYDTCGDGIDQDCNGSDSVCHVDPLDIDNDGDGFTENQGDCNDNNATIYPGSEEICYDGKDNDCDGMIDEGCSSTETTINDFINNNKGFRLRLVSSGSTYGTTPIIPNVVNETPFKMYIIPPWGFDGWGNYSTGWDHYLTTQAILHNDILSADTGYVSNKDKGQLRVVFKEGVLTEFQWNDLKPNEGLVGTLKGIKGNFVVYFNNNIVEQGHFFIYD